MRKPLVTAAVALMAAALPIGVSATPALGETAATWTVSPGGSFSGSAGQTTMWDSTSNAQFPCLDSQLTGSLKSGTGLIGTGIGTITSLTLDNCSLGGTISTGTVAWLLSAHSYSTTTGVTTLTLTKIHFAVSTSGCSYVIDGTSDTADNGKVKIKFYPAHKTTRRQLHYLSTGSTLHIYDVRGCGVGIRSGDAMFLVGAYQITPTQTITSP